MKAGVLLFPGSNCAADAYNAWGAVIKHEVSYVWHKDRDLSEYDMIIVPGGFSYGDYLRAGAIASLSPAMSGLIEFAGKGGLVIGICNGFQILTEAGLLPGTLLRNKTLRFISKPQYLRVETIDSPFTSEYTKGEVVRFPIAHNEGNYFTDDDNLKKLQDQDRIIFRYASSEGEVNAQTNPNGSIDSIAGIVNESRNVLGMMPHPERAAETVLGSVDGLKVFQSILNKFESVA